MLVVPRVTAENKDVGKQVEVGVNDPGAARRRQQQILEGTRQTRRLIDPSGKELYRRDADTKRTLELRKQMEDAELSRINREIDIARGRERGELDFGDGALGRVGEAPSADIQALQQQRMDIATQGFGAEAFQAAREARLQGLQRDQAQQQRMLRANQASSGVFGALSGAQQSALLGQQQKNTQEAERQLFLDDVSQRQQALGAAEQTVRGTEADTLQRQQYNLAQRKAEIMGRLTSQYGEAALGVAERSSAASAQAAKDYAQAVRSQGGGGKK